MKGVHRGSDSAPAPRGWRPGHGSIIRARSVDAPRALRSHAARTGPGQPCGQRARRDAGGGTLTISTKLRERQGRRIRVDGRMPGQLPRADGVRHRHWHAGRSAAANLRAVLQHQTRPGRNRSRARGGVWRGATERRNHRGGEHREQRCDVPDPWFRPPRRRRSAAPPAVDPGSAARPRDDPAGRGPGRRPP